MSGNERIVGGAVAALVGAAAVLHGAVSATGRSFAHLQSPYAQDLFAWTENFMKYGGYLGGIAVLPDGTLMMAECVTKGTRLHRFDAMQTTTRYSTVVHQETLFSSDGGCGLVYHPDGTLYLNMNDGKNGVANVNAMTGNVIRRIGPPGNAVGIAVDPITNHLVYAGSNCVATSTDNCTLLDVDPVTAVTTTRATFKVTDIAYLNAIYFDPTGAYMFLANRWPTPRVTVITRAGAIVQHLDMSGSDPVGIGFSARTPKFIVTNNTDGTMTRFDFPADDYTQAPASTLFADGGYRGDLMQAGPDGCLYVTQGGSRYDDGTDISYSKENSVVQICGGGQFAPPPGVTLNPAGTLQGLVTDAGTGNAIASATVTLSDGSSVATNAQGLYSFVISPATYVATAAAATYTSATVAGIVVSDGGTTTVNFALTKPVISGTLQGVVSDAVTGNPVAGATVTSSDGTTVVSDAAGAYSISLPPGTYSATATAPGYKAFTASSIVVNSAAATIRNLPLMPLPGNLEGVVSNTAGTPIKSATVLLSNGKSDNTEDYGRYSISSLTPGTYSATVTATNYDVLTIAGIVISNGATTTRNFTLTQTLGGLQGRVTDPSGVAVASATVTISNGRSATTDPSGRYAIESLTPGTYGAMVTATNYNALAVAGIVITNAATTTRDFMLTPMLTDLALTASAPATAIAGGALMYTFTATNSGNAAGTAVTVTHTLPPQTAFTSVTAPAGWSCAKPAPGGPGTVTCATNSMAVGDSAAFTMAVVVLCPFPMATLTVSATIAGTNGDRDPANNVASAVVAIITPVPTITSASVDRTELWPPNHKMADVQLSYTVTNFWCAATNASPKTTLSITSNEPLEPGDAVIVDEHHVRLRSEREGTGSGRAYWITISATNDGKIFATRVVTVTVPHDQGHRK